jgi:hypothetical protein
VVQTSKVKSAWDGHQPDTSAALLDVITTATSGSAKVTRSDRVLFTACEFWASARNAALHSQLKDDALGQLRAAETAFTVIGLTKAASILRRGRMALSVDTPPPLSAVVDVMEKTLAALDEPVDQMIAEFARNQAAERHFRP